MIAATGRQPRPRSSTTIAINYVEHNGNPFSPQNLGSIPTGTVIEIQVVRAPTPWPPPRRLMHQSWSLTATAMRPNSGARRGGEPAD